ncbi:unnamed protein product [Rangifer tarandus platyrhynchus]|uniref:Uncharacterized protein n=1 Tax=Rangifer tarandus platyrhynchus TaxID=3082113 RepID=A0ABN8YV46_RANTA|nr:unnamed protein product [Rangifer tarandus platyrhynchus]
MPAPRLPVSRRGRGMASLVPVAGLWHKQLPGTLCGPPGHAASAGPARGGSVGSSGGELWKNGVHTACLGQGPHKATDEPCPQGVPGLRSQRADGNFQTD